MPSKSDWFLIYSLAFIIMMTLKNTDHLFCSLMTEKGLQVFERKTTELEGNFHWVKVRCHLFVLPLLVLTVWLRKWISDHITTLSGLLYSKEAVTKCNMHARCGETMLPTEGFSTKINVNSSTRSFLKFM